MSLKKSVEDLIRVKKFQYGHPQEPKKGGVVPASTGLKYDTGKIRPGLIPPECLKAIAEVLTFGADKYSADNWKLVDPDKYVDALWRHYIAWKTGEENDAESGLAHVAHFATNALFLLWFELDKIKKQKEDGRK